MYDVFSIDLLRNGLIKFEVSFEPAFTLPSLKSVWIGGLCVGFEGKFTMTSMYVCIYIHHVEKELEYEN